MSALLDLRGLRCPISWAKAKVHLETFARGSAVDLLVDDPQAARDIPRAAESCGHHVIDVVTTVDGTTIKLEV